MKHKWKIEPRGKKSRYHVCQRCGLKVVGWTLKQSDEDYPICEG